MADHDSVDLCATGDEFSEYSYVTATPGLSHRASPRPTESSAGRGRTAARPAASPQGRRLRRRSPAPSRSSHGSHADLPAVATPLWTVPRLRQHLTELGVRFAKSRLLASSQQQRQSPASPAVCTSGRRVRSSGSSERRVRSSGGAVPRSSPPRISSGAGAVGGIHVPLAAPPALASSVPPMVAPAASASGVQASAAYPSLSCSSNFPGVAQAVWVGVPAVLPAFTAPSSSLPGFPLAQSSVSYPPVSTCTGAGVGVFTPVLPALPPPPSTGPGVVFVDAGPSARTLTAVHPPPPAPRSERTLPPAALYPGVCSSSGAPCTFSRPGAPPPSPRPSGLSYYQVWTSISPSSSPLSLFRIPDSPCVVDCGLFTVALKTPGAGSLRLLAFPEFCVGVAGGHLLRVSPEAAQTRPLFINNFWSCCSFGSSLFYTYHRLFSTKCAARWHSGTSALTGVHSI